MIARARLCFLGFCLLLAPAAGAAGIFIDSLSQRMVNELDVVDVDVRFEFGSDALEALRSGVPLVFNFEFKVTKARHFLWDQTIVAQTRRYELARHALADRYVLTDLITRERRVYGSIDEAAMELGRLRNIPLGERQDFAAETSYHGHLQVRLDIESLPAPLRPIAYISPSWRMSSDWYRWNLNSTRSD
ncbi:MAG: DUF4390 domain-containing protein [Gammaproteobacteria bacterium]|nr:DUF4390 domain-containing protein [Gammaproteobacteria bacterium]